MNIQRFTAPTSREALAKARLAFGDSTLILSNRPTENGVEVVATAEDTLAVFDESAAIVTPGVTSSAARPGTRASSTPSYRDVASQIEEDADALSMSTLSFQDYVRERMAKKRSENAPEPKLIRIPPDTTAATPAPAPAAGNAPQRIRTQAAPAPAASGNAPSPSARKPAAASASLPLGIVSELQAMKDLIEDRFNTLNWLGQARQNPVQANLMLKLIRAGYSPTLSRTILERMPESNDAAQSQNWVYEVLERNLRTDAGTPALHEEGGIFALIGATGVGKTTTAAKLAGLCARQYGAGSVGLITLDSYRVGAQEQLRAFGKMLGVVAHLAHDRAALQDLLGLLANKKMVLIDTTGVAPRDPRKREMLELIDIPQVKRLLLLNASGHGDTLEDTVSHFKSPSGQQVILSKIDEAVKLGPALDAAIRHQLTLRGVTTGQRVPEDWSAASAPDLVRSSLRSASQSVYDPKLADLGFLFSQHSASASAGILDA